VTEKRNPPLPKWAPDLSDRDRRRLRWLRRHRLQITIGTVIVGALATTLVALLDGDGGDVFVAAMFSVVFIVVTATTSFRPSDGLLYTDEPITGWGWPSPKRSGRPWGPKIRDEFDERNS